MRKPFSKTMKDDLRPECDLTKLKRVARGKYYKKQWQEQTLVLVDPELSKVFPDSASVNRALRALCDAVGKSTQSLRRPIKSAPNRKQSAA